MFSGDSGYNPNGASDTSVNLQDLGYATGGLSARVLRTWPDLKGA